MTKIGRRPRYALSLLTGQFSHLEGEGDNCIYFMGSFWRLIWKCCKAVSALTRQKTQWMLFIIAVTKNEYIGWKVWNLLQILPVYLATEKDKVLKIIFNSSAKSCSSWTSQAKLQFLESAVFSLVSRIIYVSFHLPRTLSAPLPTPALGD